MRRLITRIAALEERLLPPPPVQPSPRILALIERVDERIRQLTGAEPTVETINKYWNGDYRNAEGSTVAHH